MNAHSQILQLYEKRKQHCCLQIWNCPNKSWPWVSSGMIVLGYIMTLSVKTVPHSNISKFRWDLLRCLHSYTTLHGKTGRTWDFEMTRGKSPSPLMASNHRVHGHLFLFSPPLELSVRWKARYSSVREDTLQAARLSRCMKKTNCMNRWGLQS